jgi:NAD+ kinase
MRRAPEDTLLVASDREDFYNALRTKLNWSGGNLLGSGGKNDA